MIGFRVVIGFRVIGFWFVVNCGRFVMGVRGFESLPSLAVDSLGVVAGSENLEAEERCELGLRE